MRYKLDMTGAQKALSVFFRSTFNEAVKAATQELAKELHKALLQNTPVVTGKLLAGWNNGENLAFTAVKVPGGYEVTLTNSVEYASSVNYGHPSMNQYGGPYVVHNRVKVPVPNQRQNPADPTWVFGHFFVEESELQTEQKCYDIVNKTLNKYFRMWSSGK